MLINPSSGRGRSLRVFEEKVEPMLKDADINYKAIVTGELPASIYLCFVLDK